MATQNSVQNEHFKATKLELEKKIKEQESNLRFTDQEILSLKIISNNKRKPDLHGNQSSPKTSSKFKEYITQGRRSFPSFESFKNSGVSENNVLISKAGVSVAVDTKDLVENRTSNLIEVKIDSRSTVFFK